MRIKDAFVTMPVHVRRQKMVIGPDGASALAHVTRILDGCLTKIAGMKRIVIY